MRQHVQVPLLRKDFVIDPYQLYEARWYGADAVLLIAAALDVPQLVDLAALSQDIGLEPLVEVHTAAELEKAFSALAALSASTIAICTRFTLTSQRRWTYCNRYRQTTWW